jgi:RNA polymerase sigma factor (sigma-70 family)
MKYNNDEIEELVAKYLSLRDKVKKSKEFSKEFDQYQNYCMKKLRFLVDQRTYKYKKFSNFPDLEQDGFEALLLSLRTFDHTKGSFTWWADKYITTRISRAANTHSTIRFPLKKARELKPFKTSVIPVIVDSNPDVLENISTSETTQLVLKAIHELPESHQKLINLIYGFEGMKPHSIGNALKTLSLSRPQCVKILAEAKSQIKEKLILYKGIDAS